MALYITLNAACNHVELLGHEIVWYVGSPMPEFVRGNICNVIEVQADSTELEAIIARCKNIPLTNERVVNWYGDHAKFIIGALVYLFVER